MNACLVSSFSADQRKTVPLNLTHELLIFLLCLFCCATAARSAQSYSDNIDIDAGYLYNATGGYMPVGGLLQLIASPTGVFTSPTSSSFVTGNDILVESFAMNYTNGGGTAPRAGEDAIFSAGGSNALQGGEELQLRWFPGLTMASTSPGVGATFGAYRSDNPETGNDSNGIPWTVPYFGETLTTPDGYGFNTMLAGGSNPESAGYASFTVTAVPEPSAYALAAWILVGVAAWRARNACGGKVLSAPRT
jgi:hypothetical protein